MSNLSSLTSPKNGEIFNIQKGITEDQIDQLINYSQTDETVKKYTSDSQRFASRPAFEAWKKPNTIFYTLTNKENTLLGIIWLEELALPEFTPQKNNQINNFDPNNYHTTFAIRLYAQARGQGLSTPFTQAALTDFRLTINHLPFTVSGVWLAVSPDNSAAISSYQKSGFVELGMRQDGQKLLMILPPKEQVPS